MVCLKIQIYYLIGLILFMKNNLYLKLILGFYFVV